MKNPLKDWKVAPEDAAKGKTTDKIETGVSIKLTPEEVENLDKIISENRRTIHMILELGKELVRHEVMLWEYIHDQYPETEQFNVSFDYGRWELHVREKLDKKKAQDPQSFLPNPFSLRLSPDGRGFMGFGALAPGAGIADLLREIMENSPDEGEQED